jgi:hypothetical protein
MGVDWFTWHLREIVWIVCAPLYVALVAYVLVRVLARLTRASRGLRRPYDWAVDGECANHSHPRVLR